MFARGPSIDTSEMDMETWDKYGDDTDYCEDR
jgi:hypothetical protein